MADLQTTYTFTTPGGTIYFNLGEIGDGTDKYWIQGSPVPDGPRVRAPIDNRPFTDGTILHTFRRAGMQWAPEGVLIVESVPLNSSECQDAYNAMESALRTAVDSILSSDGTWSWDAGAITVRHHGQPELAFPPTNNYALRSFTFGLISSAGSWW